MAANFRTICIATATLLCALTYCPCAGAQRIAETVTVPVSLIPPGKQLIVTYQAVLGADTPDNTTDVRATANVAGDNFTPFPPVQAITAVTILELALGSPVHVFWNGFLQLQNVVAIINKDTAPLNVSAVMLDSEGNTLSTTALTVPASGEVDLPVNSLPGFRTDAVGTLGLITDRDVFDGNAMYYRLARDLKTLEFMHGDVFQNRIVGQSYVLFNTIQPSGVPSQLQNEVTNWLSIANMNTAPAVFAVHFYDQSGTLLRTVNVSIPPLGRRDIAAGHDDPGPGRVGLINISPTDDSSPYIAALARYGASGPVTALAKFYHFGLSVRSRTGSSKTEWAPISRGGSGQNWVVIANISPVSSRYRATFRSNSGVERGTVDLDIPAFGQLHMFANSLLAPGETGIVEVSSLQGDRFIAESDVYFFDPAIPEVTAAYVSITRRPVGSSYAGVYNTFLSQFNFLKLFDVTDPESSVSGTFSLNSSGGASLGVGGTFLNDATGVDLGIHDLPFAPGANRFGKVSVDSSQSGGILAEVLRYQSSSDGRRIEAAVSLPVR